MTEQSSPHSDHRQLEEIEATLAVSESNKTPARLKSEPSPRWSADTRIAAAALAISALALLLSQLQPLYTYFYKPQIRVSSGNQLHLSHSWGNLWGMLYLQLANDGESRGTISHLSITMLDSSAGFIRKLPVQSYYSRPDAVEMGATVSQLPFSTVDLEPGETWEHFVNFGKLPSREDQAQVAEWTRQIQSSITSQYQERPWDQSLRKIESELHSEIIAASESHYSDLKSGEYYLIVEALGESADEIIDQQIFKITILDSNMNSFRDILHQYQYGYGVYMPMQGNTGFYTSMDPISDQSIVDDFMSRMDQYKSN